MDNLLAVKELHAHGYLSGPLHHLRWEDLRPLPEQLVEGTFRTVLHHNTVGGTLGAHAPTQCRNCKLEIIQLWSHGITTQRRIPLQSVTHTVTRNTERLGGLQQELRTCTLTCVYLRYVLSHKALRYASTRSTRGATYISATNRLPRHHIIRTYIV